MKDYPRIDQESEHLFVFQPGNTTRYKLFAAKVDPDERQVYNLIVAWLKYGDMGGPSCLLRLNGEIHVNYFMEKMSMKNTPDAVAILCFMREQFGVKVWIPPEYERKQWVLDGRKESL